MANTSRITRGSAPRVLQLGLDKQLDDLKHAYVGKGDAIFESRKTDKAYYEMMKLAGMGVASLKGEGEAITYDSVDQNWVFRTPVFTYEKSARITREMIKDNLYEDLLPRIAKEQMKAINTNRDILQANILNRAETSGVTYGDGIVLLSVSHPLQAGGLNANKSSSDQDLSEDSLEALKIVADNMKNDDGILGDYEPQDLIIPPALQFEAHRILKSMGRVATADNDANALKDMGVIRNVIVWKRLTDTDAFFLTTNCEDGLILVRREGIYTQTSQDPFTFDTILSACERFAVTVGKHQAIVGSMGA